jgi:pyridoxal phosphate enzyme (YggS family)
VTIAERLAEVHERIRCAARASGRDPAEVRLVAVTKTKPVSAIREAYAAGQRDFGENYAQELNEKAAECADLSDISWHMIGHLQRNKARMIVRAASMVHSVDSVKLSEELGKRASGRPQPLAVLVEVNVGGEAQKAGCTPPELASVLDAIAAQPTLALSGLMTVPPHTDDPERARPYFDELVRLRDRHGGRSRLPELSMGMTHDLEQAIAAGATIVRVGTAIFGERD